MFERNAVLVLLCVRSLLWSELCWTLAAFTQNHILMRNDTNAHIFSAINNATNGQKVQKYSYTISIWMNLLTNTKCNKCPTLCKYPCAHTKHFKVLVQQTILSIFEIKFTIHSQKQCTKQFHSWIRKTMLRNFRFEVLWRSFELFS